jgi:hypothetical protein
MTPPKTIRDLRARIKARGLAWSVKHATVLHPMGHLEHQLALCVDGASVVFTGARLRCLELAWRLAAAEGVKGGMGSSDILSNMRRAMMRVVRPPHPVKIFARQSDIDRAFASLPTKQAGLFGASGVELVAFRYAPEGKGWVEYSDGSTRVVDMGAGLAESEGGEHV